MKKAAFRLLTAALLFSLASCGGEATDPNAGPDASEVLPAALETVAGTQTVVVEGFDWGPAVTKIIITLEIEADDGHVTAEDFAVIETKQGFAPGAIIPGTVSAPRTVIDAYTSDAMGNRADGDSNIITLELSYGPNTGSPYFYDVIGTGHGGFCEPYELSIELTADSNLTASNGASILALEISAVDLNAALIPQLEGVDLSGIYTSGNVTLTYSSYAPAGDGKQHPLVIWLHGAGEGGTDPSVPLLGNKASALFGEDFQSIMGGAFVLAPQTPDRWMIYREDGVQTSGSCYTAALMELIERYVAANPSVDTDRIYIGGCSNGGYMTMEMVMTYPDYFAAAYPICEAYADAAITDEQLEGIKDLPIWFTYAEDDLTVLPAEYSIPTVNRLKAMGGDVHVSAFQQVLDTSGLYTDENGAPYQYTGHWSWICFFNNECAENGVTLWDWLASKSR